VHLVDRVRRGVEQILGNQFVGMYPYGSLAIGDFDPGSSDLDLVVATRGSLDSAAVASLRSFHERLDAEANPWVRRLEMWYLPVAILRTHDPAWRGACLCWSTHHPMEGAESSVPVLTELAEHPDLTEDWILNRWTIRAGGIALAGPPPATLVDPVSPDMIKDTVRRLLVSNWSQHLDGPAWKYQAFTVLTMCRALYALEHGEVVTKPRAAAWAMASLDHRWVPLISDALANRSNPERRELTVTLEFLRWTIQQAAPSAGST